MSPSWASLAKPATVQVKRNASAHREGKPAPQLVHPGKLTADKSSQVCGQCHAIASFPQRDWQRGYWNRFKPGDDLHRDRNIVRPNDETSMGTFRAVVRQEVPDPQIAEQILSSFHRQRFWPDGVVRVSGREYNEITKMACYQGGKLSCLSCHSLHNYQQADDQLRFARESDQSCLQCHSDTIDAERLADHTHHPADSAGSRCFNCHMPHSTYGLLKAIRNHRMEIPSVAQAATSGRLTGCNQCHLDKSLAWTQSILKEWYPDTPDVELSEDQEKVSATVLQALEGDAGQRALAAWTMGWEDARTATGEKWLPAYLGVLLDDPYPAVRYIAARSLHRLSGYEEFAFDFVGTTEERAAARQRLDEMWEGKWQPSDEAAAALLIDGEGRLDSKAVERLLRGRDNRDLSLAE